MSNSVYRTGRALLVPLGVDIFLVMALFFVSLCTGGPQWERVVLVIIFITVSLFSLELFFREVTICKDCIKIKKLFRKKEVKWEDVSNVSTVIIRKRIYLLLTTTRDFHVLSNSFGKFASLLQKIIARVDKEKVDDNVRDLLSHPVRKIPNIILAWCAAIILSGAIYIRLFPV